MSVLTIYGPSKYLSDETRKAISDCGVSLDNYTSNVENALRVRGEDALAEQMIREIELTIEERKARAGERAEERYQDRVRHGY